MIESPLIQEIIAADLAGKARAVYDLIRGAQRVLRQRAWR